MEKCCEAEFVPHFTQRRGIEAEHRIVLIIDQCYEARPDPMPPLEVVRKRLNPVYEPGVGKPFLAAVRLALQQS